MLLSRRPGRRAPPARPGNKLCKPCVLKTGWLQVPPVLKEIGAKSWEAPAPQTPPGGGVAAPQIPRKRGGLGGGSPPIRGVWGAGDPQDSAPIPFQTGGTCSHLAKVLRSASGMISGLGSSGRLRSTASAGSGFSIKLDCSGGTVNKRAERPLF